MAFKKMLLTSRPLLRLALRCCSQALKRTNETPDHTPRRCRRCQQPAKAEEQPNPCGTTSSSATMGSSLGYYRSFDKWLDRMMGWEDVDSNRKHLVNMKVRHNSLGVVQLDASGCTKQYYSYRSCGIILGWKRKWHKKHSSEVAEKSKNWFEVSFLLVLLLRQAEGVFFVLSSILFRFFSRSRNDQRDESPVQTLQSTAGGLTTSPEPSGLGFSSCGDWRWRQEDVLMKGAESQANPGKQGKQERQLAALECFALGFRELGIPFSPIFPNAHCCRQAKLSNSSWVCSLPAAKLGCTEMLPPWKGKRMQKNEHLKGYYDS